MPKISPKRPAFPTVMMFEGLGDCFWQGPAVWRCPNKGEWFVSGAIPCGYQARQHLTTEYWIVKPTHYAKHVTAHQRGAAVEFTQGGVPLPRKPREKDFAE